MNTFCPEINSQCYWIHPDTHDAVKAHFTSLYQSNTTKPYEPVCLVLQGQIDRESSRTGFAADYDGYLHVRRVFGTCSNSDVITQGALQHHRWMLTMMDGRKVQRAPDNLPWLEVGEAMHVSGFTGCNQMQGKASLRGNLLVVPNLATSRKACSGGVSSLETMLVKHLTRSPQISLDAARNLILDDGPSVTRWQLNDWKK